jgi:hypothetical protein
MTNDFSYDMSEINEEEIMKGWEEMVSEDGSVWETGYDPTGGLDDEWDDGWRWDDDMSGEEDFA